LNFTCKAVQKVEFLLSSAFGEVTIDVLVHKAFLFAQSTLIHRRFARISHGVYDESKPDIDATRLLDTLEKLYQRHEGLDRMAEFSPKGERIDAEALVDERYASKVLEKVGTEAAAEVVAAVSWYLERKKAQEIT
jgi:hypothetical protein